MERINKCIRFQSKRITWFTVIFTLIYLVSYALALAVMALEKSQISKQGTINGNFGFFAIIIAFIGISTMYKSFFNNLLIFGNTRETILSAFFAFAVLFSAVLAVLSEISELVSGCIEQILPFVKKTGLTEFYPNLNPGGELLLFFSLILLFVMAGYLYGAFTYKIGRIFVIIFWCGVGLLFTFIPLLANPPLFSAFIALLKAFFGYGYANGVYLCSLHFLIVSIALGVILWLVAIKQPQNA
jgi:hypothetical protein